MWRAEGDIERPCLVRPARNRAATPRRNAGRRAPVNLWAACPLCGRLEDGLERSKGLDWALDELLSGHLPATQDQELRELVRIASRVRHSKESLTAERRAALRARVLRRLDVEPEPSLRESLGAVADALAKPLPLLSRAGLLAAIVLLLATSTGLAAADTLPDDPLYGVKLATEQVRLSLAQRPEDVAAVELTIAETRFREATALSASARDSEADAAVSAYGEHLASAVASMEEARPEANALVLQLQARVWQQHESLASPKPDATPNAVSVLVGVTQEIANGSSSGGSIADAAARAAEQAADMASARVEDAVGATPDASPSIRATTKRKEKMESAAKAAKEAAERAREAAERAKRASTESFRLGKSD